MCMCIPLPRRINRVAKIHYSWAIRLQSKHHVEHLLSACAVVVRHFFSFSWPLFFFIFFFHFLRYYIFIVSFFFSRCVCVCRYRSPFLLPILITACSHLVHENGLTMHTLTIARKLPIHIKKEV